MILCICKRKKTTHIIKEKMSERLLNIYDEPLEPCGTPSMNSGSWDENGRCSEKDGGVHQICIRQIANTTESFSKVTGQSNWSESRGNDNHCVCLGAWSLYNSKDHLNNNRQSSKSKNKKILKCEAIPKMSLSKDYVSKFQEGWNKWNGLELNNQIVNGEESLIDQCYESGEQKKYKMNKLRNNYCNFAKDVTSLRRRETYNRLCK